MEIARYPRILRPSRTLRHVPLMSLFTNDAIHSRHRCWLLQVDSAQEKRTSQGLSFVYPYGATLNVSKSSVALLGTGTACFPLQRPICALNQRPNSGRIVVLASCHMLSDLYIDKEENNKIQVNSVFFFGLLLHLSQTCSNAVACSLPTLALSVKAVLIRRTSSSNS